jgi:hypothetical protein
MDRTSNPEVKMHAEVLFPHEIWDKYAKYLGYTYYNHYMKLNSVDMSLEALWKNLADLGDCGNTMVVVDGSMSMMNGNGSVRPIDIARSLGVYFAERCKGEFNNILMEFSRDPKLINLNDCKTLMDKYVKLSRYDDCTSTNIEEVFMLILRTAIVSEMKQSDLPDRILIVSDMEFNDATYCTNCGAFSYGMKGLFEELADRYEQYGYKLPKLVFWNVNSRTNTIPMTVNEMGVIMVSGFSPNIMSMIMSGQTDPWIALKEKLDSKRYDCISDTLKSVRI